jgi:hypothetical protein
MKSFKQTLEFYIYEQNEIVLFICVCVCVVDYIGRCSDGVLAGQPGFDSRQGQYISLLYSVQTDSGTQLASCPKCTGPLSLGVKRQEREADHLSYCRDQE